MKLLGNPDSSKFVINKIYKIEVAAGKRSTDYIKKNSNVNR
jgi:hypothetical protein